MAKSKGLGKGLDAILPAGIVEEVLDETTSKTRDTLPELPIDQIFPNPLQPRMDFDEAALAELAESIKSQGLLQPILVVRDRNGYMLIAGERRLRASKLAGFEQIPAIVLERKPSDEKILFLALVENLQREDLDAVEEAIAYRTLAEKFALTQESIAEKVGKSRSAVANAMRILRLPSAILDMIKARKISGAHARALLEETDPQRQIRLAALAARRGLSVERLSILVNKKADKAKRLASTKTAEHLALEEELSMALGTRVEIVKAKKKSKLVIEMFSDEDLNYLAEKLLKVWE